jgi:DNA polymerase-3 subunit epsilon
MTPVSAWSRRWQAIQAWRAGRRAGGRAEGPAAGTRQVGGQDRWVILDCETTGLDPERDLLLSIGAVAMIDGAIRLSDRFERTLRPSAQSSSSNVLIHGIGLHAQKQGESPEQVLREWQDWVAGAPCVAFHAAFDRSFLERAARQALGHEIRLQWLDLAELGPAVDPSSRARALDDWLDRYGIRVSPRHHASADALASAMLLQRWLARLAPDERRFSSLTHLARNRHFLRG